VHAQRVVLLFNVRRRDAVNVRLPDHHVLFCANDFGGGIPTRRIFVEINHAVGFYDLPVIHVLAESLPDRLTIGRKAV